MTRPLWTGSGTERVELCPASEALPHVRRDSGDARKGTAIHAFLALVPKVGRESALELIPVEHREACAAIDITRIPILDGAGFAAEVALAYDVELGTAREIGRDIGRAYGPLGPMEVPLTLDVLGLGRDGESVFVADFKSGRGRVTPAARNGQLKLGAVAAARAYGRERAEVAIVHVYDDGGVFFDTAKLDIFDLETAADELRLTAAAVMSARQLAADGVLLDVVAGEHCRYCPAFDACPAKRSLLRLIVEQPGHVRGTVNAALKEAEDPAGNAIDNATARQAYEVWKRAKEVIDRAGDQLHAYAAEHGGIDLGDGRVFGPVKTTRDYVEGNIVHTVLEKLHGKEIADRAVTLEATKEGIRNALRVVVANTPGAKITKVFDAAIAEIDALGGIDRRFSTTVKEHIPRAKKEIAS